MKPKDYEALLPTIELGDCIPRLIHQTYKSKTDLEEKLLDNIKRIKQMNPSWSYTLYDDEDIRDFIQGEYGPEIWQYYERIERSYGAARADLFRYLLMYKRGGVYLDIKSSFTQPLDEVLSDSDLYILSPWDNLPGQEYEGFGMLPELTFLPRGEYIQWAIICAPGHPFLRAVLIQVFKNIDHYEPFSCGVGLYGVIKTTGPVAYSHAIEPVRQQLDKGKYRLLNWPGEVGLQYSIYHQQGAYAHKKALKANYNIKHIPVIKQNYHPLKGRLVNGLLWLRLVGQILRDKLKRIKSK